MFDLLQKNILKQTVRISHLWCSPGTFTAVLLWVSSLPFLGEVKGKTCSQTEYAVFILATAHVLSLASRITNGILLDRLCVKESLLLDDSVKKISKFSRIVTTVCHKIGSNKVVFFFDKQLSVSQLMNYDLSALRGIKWEYFFFPSLGG